MLILEEKVTKTIVFYCRKWIQRPFRVHESAPTLTKSRACHRKQRPRHEEILERPSKGPLPTPPGPLEQALFGELRHGSQIFNIQRTQKIKM